MDQVKIKIVKLKTTQTTIYSTFDIVFVAMPKLAGYKQVLSLDSGGKALLKSLSNFLFIAVDSSTINVPISIDKNGLFNDFCEFTLI